MAARGEAVTRFGVQVHGTFPMTRYPEIARIVERYPFHELTVHDVVWWRPVWPILTLVAANSDRVLVGPDVTHPYLRHPVETAASVAALDELTGGRAILGLGAGSMLESVGIETVKPLVAVRECAELVGRFLARERAPYEGEVFRAAEGAQFFWDPPRSSVPTFVGAFRPRMVEAAAGWADEIRPPAVWATDYFLELRGRVERAAAAAARRDGPRVGCDVWVVVDADRDAARALGRRLLAQFLPLAEFEPLTEFYEIDQGEIAEVAELKRVGDLEGAAARISDRTLDTFVAAGDPAAIRTGLRRLLDTGPSTVTFSGRLGRDPVHAIELLGQAVLPEFAGAH
jgi:5,10-methylenetetrahydromethanopterin reductase